MKPSTPNIGNRIDRAWSDPVGGFEQQLWAIYARRAHLTSSRRDAAHIARAAPLRLGSATASNASDPLKRMEWMLPHW